MNLYSILEHAARQWPNAIALAQDGNAFSYGALADAASRLADHLRRLGVGPGCKVVILFPRCVEYVVSCFAVLRQGSIAVPMSSALKRDEIARLAVDIAPDAYCYSAALGGAVPYGDESSRLGLSAIDGRRMTIEMKSASPRPGAPTERDRLRAVDAAYICFSSGTTSRSKGIVLPHQALMERATQALHAPQVTRATSILWLRAFDRFVPHQIMRAFSVGARVVLGTTFEADLLPEWIAKYHVDQVWAPPTFYRALLHAPLTRNELQPIRHFLSSGAPLPVDVAADFRARFGHEISQTYGSAECSPIFINASEDPAKRGSVGLPVPGREVRLMPNSGEDSADPAQGELAVRGGGMFAAYYNPWIAREEVSENGWFRTGDIARRDADGYYWVVGRIKEAINVGGAKVFPRELEEILLAHPDVDDCVVYGAPDPRYGEVPHAKVKLRGAAAPTQQQLLDFVGDRVSVMRALRKIEFTDRIDRTVTGKIRRW